MLFEWWCWFLCVKCAEAGTAVSCVWQKTHSLICKFAALLKFVVGDQLNNQFTFHVVGSLPIASIFVGRTLFLGEKILANSYRYSMHITGVRNLIFTHNRKSNIQNNSHNT